MHPARLVFAFLLTAVPVTALGLAHHVVMDDDGLVPGLRVGATPVATVDDVRRVAAAEADRLQQRRVRLVAEGDKVLVETTLGALGVSVDQDKVMARTQSYGHSGDWYQRGRARLAAYRGEVSVPIVTRTDGEKLHLLLQGLKETFDTPPTSARLDLDSRQVIAEKDGRYLDEHGAAEALEALIASDSDTLRVPIALFPPRISSAFVKALDISSVLGEYETFFSRGGDQARRGKNIDVASSKLDGLILSPGELVSFNAIVGERSEANGFQKSWEIFKGEMVEGTGGGTCQVASTFHAATFFAGLDVLERLPHSRPSAYIPMGLDSTVVYPSVDLKIKNPHPFPVVVHARTIGNKLKVEVLGRSKPVSVAFGRDVVATVPYTRKVTEEPGLSGKKIVVKQHGIRGYRIKRSRVLTYADGTKKVETTSDFYPPTTEIYLVPVGFDVSALPALPVAEGDDKDPVAAPATPATPPTPATPSSAQPVADARPEVELVDGPGAHAPTAAQANPSKSVFLRR